MPGLALSPLPERKVLLAIREGYLDPRLLVSAHSLCQRLGAGLDILLASRQRLLPPEVVELISTLRAEGVPYTITNVDHLHRRDVVRYANTHECVTTVIIDSLEGWESTAPSRATNPWKSLSCPLVTAVPAKQAKEKS